MCSAAPRVAAAVLLPRQLPHLHLEPVPLVPVLLYLPVHISPLVAGDTGRRLGGREGAPEGVPGDEADARGARGDGGVGQEEAEAGETILLAEFTVERSAWTDKEAMLTSGFHAIEDIVDGELPSFSFFELPAVGRAGF